MNHLKIKNGITFFTAIQYALQLLRGLLSLVPNYT
jgi:hypothetical protein